MIVISTRRETCKRNDVALSSLFGRLVVFECWAASKARCRMCFAVRYNTLAYVVISKVGADVHKLLSYCGRVIGWVSDFGTELVDGKNTLLVKALGSKWWYHTHTPHNICQNTWESLRIVNIIRWMWR